MNGIQAIQVMAAALACTETCGFAAEYAAHIERTPLYDPRVPWPTDPPGVKGHWDKCVAHRAKKLASRKRQKQARKKQRRSK